MPLRHTWKPLQPLFDQGTLASCGMPAGQRCDRCHLAVCQLLEPCQYCVRTIEQECRPIRKPPGRPPEPADPSKPRRKASQEKAIAGMQLFDCMTHCTSCNRAIFEGDAYCRHCGIPQKHSGSSEHQSKGKTIYLASDLAFSEHQKEALLQPVVAALQELGLDIHMSSDRSEPVPSATSGWAYRLGQKDFAKVAQADAIFVIHGHYPDEGVMLDLGIAIALGKPTFLFRGDTRPTAGDEEYPLNLKLFVGMPRDGWRDHYYTSVEEIIAPGKALFQWAKPQPRHP